MGSDPRERNPEKQIAMEDTSLVECGFLWDGVRQSHGAQLLALVGDLFFYSEGEVSCFHSPGNKEYWRLLPQITTGQHFSAF